ncbi:hypothetical protein LTR22_028285 [Elasticomyces elasticus]|nr:hypothetical protein LTR22_028285 [Elasticomyces elasticus]
MALVIEIKLTRWYEPKDATHHDPATAADQQDIDIVNEEEAMVEEVLLLGSSRTRVESYQLPLGLRVIARISS